MAEFVVVVAPTVCTSQSDSVPAWLGYVLWIISRSRSESTLLPSFAATVAGEAVQVESVTLEGPVSVELAGLSQSTWNFQTRATFADQITVSRFSRPAGGVP